MIKSTQDLQSQEISLLEIKLERSFISADGEAWGSQLLILTHTLEDILILEFLVSSVQIPIFWGISVFFLCTSQATK